MKLGGEHAGAPQPTTVVLFDIDADPSETVDVSPETLRRWPSFKIVSSLWRAAWHRLKAAPEAADMDVEMDIDLRTKFPNKIS